MPFMSNWPLLKRPSLAPFQRPLTIAWIEGGNLKAAGFILHQSDELKAHGTIEEIDFGNYKKRRLKEIEDRTGLRFPELLPADTYRE